MAVVAQGVVELIPSAKGFSSKLQRELGGELGKAGDRQGRGLGVMVAGGFKKAAKVGFAGAAVVAGTALAKGFGRLKGLEEAQAKMKGLGYDTGEVDTIMDGALKSVKGTSFGLDEAANVAAQAVAAGVKPGKALDGVLSTVANSAAAAGTDMGQMGDIFGKVASTGRAYQGDLNQVATRGIPIYETLASQFGVTSDEVRKMASKGEISFEDFSKAMETASGSVAKEMGNTVSGSWANFMASLGRIGAGVLSGIYPKIAPGLQKLTDMLGVFEGKAAGAGEAIGSGLGVAIGFVGDKVGAFVADFKAGEGAAGLLRSALEKVAGFVTGTVVPAVSSLVGWMVRNKDVVAILAGGILAGVVAFKAFMFIKTVIAAVKAARLAMIAFNASLLANPVGLVIAALTALGIGLVLAYKKSDTFRRIVDGAWRGIKTAASAVTGWFKTVAWPALSAVFRDIGRVATWLWRNIFGPVFRGIGSLVSWWYNNYVKRYFALVRVAFRTVAAVAKWLWQKALRPAFQGTAATIAWLYKNGVRPAFARIAAIWRTTAKVAKWLWRNGIRPAFSGIASTAKWLWARLKGVFRFIAAGVRGVAKIAKWLWRNGIQPAFSGIARLGSWLWGRLKSSFAFMRRGFQGVQKIAKWLWENGIRPTFRSIADRASWLWGKVRWAFDKLKGGLRSVRDAFRVARDKIGTLWGGILGKIRKPIGQAMRWLQNNFVKKLNAMLGKIPGIPSKGPIPNLAVPKGYAAGGYTGPGGRNDPAGIVHRDEFVVRKSSRRKFERANPGALDHLNRTGNLPGYRIGGKVAGLNPRFKKMLDAFNVAAGGRYSVYSGYRSNAHQRQLYNRYLAGNGPVAARPGSSMHNRGLAADLAPSDARNVHGGLARSMGLIFTVPSESWHIEPSWGRGSNAGPGKGGGGAGGFGFGLPEWATNPLKWVKGKIRGLTDSFDPSKFGLAGKVGPAVFDWVRDGSVRWLKEAAGKLNPLGDPSGMNIGGSIKGIQNMGTKAAVRAVANQYGWGRGRQWSAIDWIVNRESGWNPRAANPTSSARGLFQKMTSIHGPLESTIEGQARWGLNYFRKRYGTPMAAKRFWERNRWYDDGGIASGVGVMQKNTLEPERVLSPRQTAAFEDWMRSGAARARATTLAPPVAAGGMSGPVTVNVIDRDGTLLDRVRGEIEANDKHVSTRTRMGAGRRF